MAPIRIRYHVPQNTTPEVIRYNDPLIKGNRKHPQDHRSHHTHRNHKHHRLRDNRSDFDYDYGPQREDFEHMRRSVPDEYWGPFNPYVYRGRQDHDSQGDGRFYDFKYDSYRKYDSEANYADDYDPEARPGGWGNRPAYGAERRLADVDYNRGQETDRSYHSDRRPHRDFEYERGYQSDRRPPRDFEYERGYQSDRRPPRDLDYERGYQSDRRPPPDVEHERGYHSDRRQGHLEYNRGGYYSDRRPEARDYDRDYYARRGHNYYGDPRYDPSPRRPQYVQSDIIMPRDRWRPLPYLGDPKRKRHEHRRGPVTDGMVQYHHRPNRHGDRHYDDYPQRKYTHHISPRSEAPDPYYSPSPHAHVIADERLRLSDQARETVMRKGHRNPHQYGYCDACPEKSSKYIPTMHYDELKCPNCQKKVQPTQDEVLAYPWTVQTFRPKKPPTEVPESIITPSVYTVDNTIKNKNTIDSNKTIIGNATKPSNRTEVDNAAKKAETKTVASRKSAPQAAARVTDDKPVSKPTARSKQEDKGQKNNNKENADTKAPDKQAKSQAQSLPKAPLSDKANVAPSEPLFRSKDEAMPKTEVGGRSFKAGGKSTKKKPGLETVKEHHNENEDSVIVNLDEVDNDFGDFDDILPQDSVSNVKFPLLRAFSKGPNKTDNQRVTRPRAETELTTYSYPSGRYFPSLEYVPPPAAQATPLPGRRGRPQDQARTHRGQYYDRRSGRIYEYDVNYAGRRPNSNRRPLR